MRRITRKKENRMLKKILVPVLSLAVTIAVADGAKGKRPSIAEGKKTFQTYCAACHGEKGKGDGPAAAALTPKPRNYTDTAFMTKEPKSRCSTSFPRVEKRTGFRP